MNGEDDMFPPDRIEEPAAWRGEDMAAAPGRWTMTLTEDDVVAIFPALGGG